MAADFTVPLRYRFWTLLDGTIKWNATWDAANFDQATTSAYWGTLGSLLEGRLICIDDITLKVTAATGGGAIYTPQFMTLPGSNEAMPGGETQMTEYGTDYLNWQPRGYHMVASGEVNQVGLGILAANYASTDDLVLYVSGRAVVHRETDEVKV